MRKSIAKFIAAALLVPFAAAAQTITTQQCRFVPVYPLACNGDARVDWPLGSGDRRPVVLIRHGATPLPGYHNVVLPAGIPNPAYITKVGVMWHMGNTPNKELFGGYWTMYLNHPTTPFNLAASMFRDGTHWQDWDPPVYWADETISLTYGCQMATQSDQGQDITINGGVQPDVQICWMVPPAQPPQ